MPKNNYITRVDSDTLNNVIVDERFPSDSHFYASFSENTTSTNIAAANTPVNISGTYVLNTSKNFNFNIDTATYTYKDTALFKIYGSFTARATVGGIRKYNFYVGKNGLSLPETRDTEYLDNNLDEVRTPSVSAILSLSENDTISLQVENTQDGQDILLETLSWIITMV